MSIESLISRIQPLDQTAMTAARARQDVLTKPQVQLPETASKTEASDALNVEVESLLSCMDRSKAGWIIVSNEVGLGLVPPYPLGRIYRDALGRANQRLAARADRSILMVAGLPVRLAKQ